MQRQRPLFCQRFMQTPLRTACVSALVLMILLSSCTSRSIFRSPYTTQQNSYHVMPNLTDEQPTAHYLTLSASTGASNDYWRDETILFQGKYHVAGKLGKHLQGFAGAHGTAGWYDISSRSYLEQYDPVTGQYTQYYGPQGNKFTGSVGGTAGLAVVIPLGDRVEWRVIGAEMAVGQEFGAFYKARVSIPDSAVDLTDRRRTHLNAGGFTEWIFKPRDPEKQLGYQIAFNSSLHRLRNQVINTYNMTPFSMHHTFHFTVRRYTGIVRLSVSQFYGSAQLGFAYKL